MAYDAMAATRGNLPPLPARHAEFIEHVAAHPQTTISELLEPYLSYEAALCNRVVELPEYVYEAEEDNIVPIFAGQEGNFKIRARDLHAETDSQKQAYILPLSPDLRKPNGSPAIVPSLEDFKAHLSIFSERSLVDLDWANVVAAGGAVATCLLPVPLSHSKSTAVLRQYYHEVKSPATDVDLYLYGLTDEDAFTKIQQIEQAVRSVSLFETTTIRTKNSIVIASQHPVRHVTINLRIFRSISELLSTFDVDSSCMAFDGEQVWASPRGLVAWMTQTNTVDPTRRSPFYEERLAKYRSLDFEVHYPGLDRSRIDPYVYQRDITSVDGLPRLLLLEHLPARAKNVTEETRYCAELNLPSFDRVFLKLRRNHRDLKTSNPYDIAEWVDVDERSIFHTYNIPYGAVISASDIEVMLDKEDEVLNRKPLKRRPQKHKLDEQILHRHSMFFGNMEDVLGDCCDDCPVPQTSDEKITVRQNDKIFVSGTMTLSRSGPLRQREEVLRPRTREDYTQQAYVGVTDPLCHAIADCNLSLVQSLLGRGGDDINGRDINGRTPLHLASACSTVDIVQCLLEHGAYLVPRQKDGKAAIDIACIRGDVDIVSVLLRQDAKNRDRFNAGHDNCDTVPGDREFDDINVPFSQHEILISPLHLAVSYNNLSLVENLVQEWNADIHQRMEMVEGSLNRGDAHYYGLERYLTPLALALRLPLDAAQRMTRLLFKLGASSEEKVDEYVSVLQACITSRPALLDTYFDADFEGTVRSTSAIFTKGQRVAQSRPGLGYGKPGDCVVSTPLLTAIQARDTTTATRLLEMGAKATLPFEAFAHVLNSKTEFLTTVAQPVIVAVEEELPLLAIALIREYDADVNTLTPNGWKAAHESALLGTDVPESLLNCVDRRIESLRSWIQAPHEPRYKKEVKVEREPMRENAFYLGDHAKDTYSYCSYDLMLDRERERLERFHGTPAQSRSTQSLEAGFKEKLTAIESILNAFLVLKDLLDERSAKLFRDLHPQFAVQDQSPSSDRTGSHSRPWKPEIRHSYSVPSNYGSHPTSYSNYRPDNYVGLFEAVWRGDIARVKSLTLLPGQDPTGTSCPPLTIAVADLHQDSPFTIALSRGHLELARAIYLIAEAQYQPSIHWKRTAKRSASDSGHSADDDDTESDVEESEFDESEETTDDESELDESEQEGSVDGSDFVASKSSPAAGLSARKPGELAALLADDDISIDDVRRVETSVANPVSPALMFTWRCPKTIERRNKDDASDSIGRQEILPRNMTAMALFHNDLDMLSCLLDLAEEPIKTAFDRQGEEVKPGNSHAVDDHAFRVALQSANSTTLAMLIERTAAGVPLDELSGESQLQVSTEKAGQCRGLKTGKVRAQDASRSVQSKRPKNSDRISPPLLHAANLGSFANLQWLLSDAPLEHYRQYATENPNDHRVRQISQSPEGFGGIVKSFLGSRSELAIICCVMSKSGSEGLEILSHLIKIMPDAVNARSSAGDTPLLIAYRFQNLQAAKLLIKAGADQTARDHRGGNVLHCLFDMFTNAGGGNGSSYVPEVANEKHYVHMRAMMDLLDEDLLPIICTQRHHASDYRWYTPLASLLYHACTPNSFLVATARMILEYSKGAELGLLDNEGNTPLHLLVYKNTPPTHFDFYGVAALIMEFRPDLVNLENTSGKTPLDMAQDGALRAMCKGRNSLRKYGQQDWRPLYTTHEYYTVGFSVTCTPEKAFTKPEIDYDDFGGHDMARLLLSGEIDPSPSKDQRIVSLYRLLAETKAKLDREGKGKRIVTSVSEVRAAADMDNTEKLHQQHDDGYLAETDLWLNHELQQRLIRAQFPGCDCSFCLRFCISVPSPESL